MRRITTPPYSYEHCLRRAVELDWLADNAPTPRGAALRFDEARHWRSLALVAEPEADKAGHDR